MAYGEGFPTLTHRTGVGWDAADVAGYKWLRRKGPTAKFQPQIWLRVGQQHRRPEGSHCSLLPLACIYTDIIIIAWDANHCKPKPLLYWCKYLHNVYNIAVLQYTWSLHWIFAHRTCQVPIHVQLKTMYRNKANFHLGSCVLGRN